MACLNLATLSKRGSEEPSSPASASPDIDGSDAETVTQIMGSFFGRVRAWPLSLQRETAEREERNEADKKREGLGTLWKS